MGNEMGTMEKASLPDLNNVFTPPRLRSFGSMNSLLASNSATPDKGSPAASSTGPSPLKPVNDLERAVKAIKRLKKKGAVNLGDTFTTWRSSKMEESSYVNGRVVEVKREGLKAKSVVLEYRLEVDIPTLQSQVSRAQQAQSVEQEWKQKLAALGLTSGTKADLWVSTNHKPEKTTATRRRSSLKTHLASPTNQPRRRVGSSRVLSPEPEPTSLAQEAEKFGAQSEPPEASEGHAASPQATPVKGGGSPLASDGVEDTDDNVAHTPAGAKTPPSAGNRLSATASPIPNPEELLAADPLEGVSAGDVFTYTLLEVDVRWHFQEAIVDLQLAKNLPDGSLGGTEALPYSTVRTMVENANIAKEVLQEELRVIKQQEGIAVGSKVDLWIPELNTNVRGVVSEIGHTFKTLETVELTPVVKYFVNGQKQFKHFEDYVSFVTSWKQAKYVKEQQLGLTQRAFEMGVQVGSTVSVEQAPHSPRWRFRHHGVLDAEVRQLEFDFDVDAFTVSMRVLLRYLQQSGSDFKTDRRVPLVPSDPEDEDLIDEWVQWETLAPLLKAQIIVSQVKCEHLLDFGSADPYVKVILGGSKRKTPSVPANVSPSWEDMTFVFREGEDVNRSKSKSKKGENFFDQTLQIKVADSARGSKRHNLGMVTVPLQSLLPHGEGEFEVTLEPEKKEKAKKNETYGTVSFKVTARGPGVTHARSRLLSKSSNQEFAQKKRDGKDLFFEAYSGDRQ